MGTIKKVNTDTNDVIQSLDIRDGRSLTPKQMAKAIDNGEKFSYKGVKVQSVGGEYVRTEADGKSGNNLVPRK